MPVFLSFAGAAVHRFDIKHRNGPGFLKIPMQTPTSKSEYEQKVTSLPLQETSSPAVSLEEEESLKWIIGQLKTFIHELSFDVAGFDVRAEVFGQAISDISQWAHQLVPTNHDLMTRLRFTQHVYYVMKTSSEYLKYVNTGGTASFLVRQVVQLNVWVLQMYDGFGNPDSNREWFDATVSGFRRILNYWRSIFDNLQDVPVTVQIIFDSQCVQVERSLETLARYHRDI
ncbi:hypothetical protein JCM33374_g3812 [Metschnikowia sp. JCM 33374]|nr:hypothetical protein JCM33374_g3812 [Metschnikowia sp. JCM 33374]